MDNMRVGVLSNEQVRSFMSELVYKFTPRSW